MHVDDDEGVRTITFDRPEAMNAFTTETAADLAETVAAVDPDGYDVIVLTGEGEAFSAGGDVESMADREENPREAYDRVTETFGSLAEELLACRVPVVAKVNGDAVGAGLAVTALSDFAYAAADARFSCAFVRVGLIPDTGGTYLLPRLVGLRTAKELAFTGEFVDAERAADLDLITAAVDPGELEERVSETVDRLRRRPTETIGLMKRAIHGNLGRGWADALDREAMLQVQAYASDAHEEGVDAFLEGRRPEFE